MRTQKIYEVGNSLVVTIPREIAERYRLEPGAPVLIKEGDEGIIFEPVRKQTPSRDVKEALKAFERKYKAALFELAKL